MMVYDSTTCQWLPFPALREKQLSDNGEWVRDIVYLFSVRPGFFEQLIDECDQTLGKKNLQLSKASNPFPRMAGSLSDRELWSTRSSMKFRGGCVEADFPGDRIVESDLAQGLGISRVPVREALQILEKQGLVVNEPYKGIRLRTVTQRRSIISSKRASRWRRQRRLRIVAGRNDAKAVQILERHVDELELMGARPRCLRICECRYKFPPCPVSVQRQRGGLRFVGNAISTADDHRRPFDPGKAHGRYCGRTPKARERVQVRRCRGHDEGSRRSYQCPDSCTRLSCSDRAPKGRASIHRQFLMSLALSHPRSNNR